MQTDIGEATTQEGSPDEPLPFATSEEIKKHAPKKMIPNTDYSTFRQRVKFVLFTVNENEFNAGTIYVTSPDIENDHARIRKCTVLEAGVCMGMFARLPVGLIKTDMGRNCQDELAKITKCYPNVKYSVSIGVCYAFDHNRKFADVLISNKISAIDIIKINESFIESRDHNTTLEGEMKRIFCDNPSIVEEFPVSKNRCAKFYTGHMASCSILINSRDFRDLIRASLNPEPIGGEMEGGELIRFMKKERTEVIIIKGVADYADGNKEKSWQPIAAAAAFHYAEQKMSSLTASPGASASGTTMTEDSDINNSYEELVAGIPKEVLDKNLSDGYLRPIATKFIGWEKYPVKFNLKEIPDVHDIMNDNMSYPTLQARRVEALKRWRTKTVHPTYKNLILICMTTEMMDCARAIVSIIKK